MAEASTLWLRLAVHETNKALDVGSWVWEASEGGNNSWA